ncbi:hypothetical protein NL676_034085 [Syzygium grande]|nr:hypothetical protein NL676_034085 [Syzygium grande]
MAISLGYPADPFDETGMKLYIKITFHSSNRTRAKTIITPPLRTKNNCKRANELNWVSTESTERRSDRAVPRKSRFLTIKKEARKRRDNPTEHEAPDHISDSGSTRYHPFHGEKQRHQGRADNSKETTKDRNPTSRRDT